MNKPNTISSIHTNEENAENNLFHLLSKDFVLMNCKILKRIFQLLYDRQGVSSLQAGTKRL